MQLTPILSLLLVHDLLLAKRGIALPATHGLRASVDKHKARLQAEFTKARVRRKLGSIEALKEYVESDGDNPSSSAELSHPRWIRINTVKTQLEDQLETTFAGFERANTINAVRQRGVKRIYIDSHIPNLVAVPSSVDLSKTTAYSSGTIIFQDKASCFPAYLLDPLPEDGDVIDTCAAPGNKTTHIAAIMLSHAEDPEDFRQRVYAFEKNKTRADTLKKMLNLAGSDKYTKVNAGQDFLKVDPIDDIYKNVGALLLDPSCSGSGIVGRDDMPEPHLPSATPTVSTSTNPRNKSKSKKPKAEVPEKDSLKRKREAEKEPMETMIDDDGEITAVTPGEELENRLKSLSSFQLALLLHAMRFPSARKLTYSTCSIHAEENESVVLKALASPIAKERGWRLLRRSEQVRGLQEWPVRGSPDACDGNQEISEGCIRANKGDEHGTMGFFLAAFVRDATESQDASIEAQVLRDEKGFIVRDMMGVPVAKTVDDIHEELDNDKPATNVEDVEWGGFDDEIEASHVVPAPVKKVENVSRPRGSRPNLLGGKPAGT